MGLFHHESDQAKAHDQVMNASDEHKGHLSHDAIAAAAAYEAAKAYQEHCAKNGKPTSHEKAKEIFAALSGAAVTHLFETKGLNFIDKEKAKRDAQKHAEESIASEY